LKTQLPEVFCSPIHLNIHATKHTEGTLYLAGSTARQREIRAQQTRSLGNKITN